MRLSIKSFIISVLLFVFVQNLSAQMMIKATGDVFNLPELSAVIVEQDKKIVVIATMAHMRPADYKDIDLENNDQIFMANGKKIKSVKQLKNMYNELAVGDKLKMAVKRGDENQLVSFAKADPEDLPKMKIQTKTLTPEEAAEMEKNGGGMKIMRKTVGPDGKVKTEINGKEVDKKDD
ncbi:MAG: PDZ domain-containing protein [Calditrichaeota bacterium]|nr:MAG: PDZ domain-containing protein [Calditrichota bacterium]MBL1207297.1 PDZ domain-containing protein [Calditrichota bacterium]NOG47129.1 PDZ domain-containing protein [Calditrichota bacterium]